MSAKTKRAPGHTRHGIRDLDHITTEDLPAAVHLEGLPPIRVSRASTGEIVASMPYRRAGDLALAYRLAAVAVIMIAEAGAIDLQALPTVKLGPGQLAVFASFRRADHASESAVLDCVERAAILASRGPDGAPTHRVEVLRR